MAPGEQGVMSSAVVNRDRASFVERDQEGRRVGAGE